VTPVKETTRARRNHHPTFSGIALRLCVVVAVGLAPFAASGRDDVPEEIASRKNPVTLEESEIRYYERQFKGKCARCHGEDGRGNGGEPVEPPLVAPADLTDADRMTKRTDGQLFYQLLKGGGDRCAMPAFGPWSNHGWSEDKIWHMVAYVRRFAEDGGP